MDDELKQNLTAGETWVRGLFILLFAFFLFISRIVTSAIVVIQFLFTVFTGKTNDNLKKFGASLSRYIYQCLLFLTYNSDVKPYPFEAWPESNLLTEKEDGKTGSVTVKATPKKKAKPKTATKKITNPDSEIKPEADADSPSDESGTEPKA